MKYKIDVGDSLITPNPTEIKLTDVLIEKYRQVKVDGKIYAGVKTGYNQAFIISKETKEKLISQDSNSAKIIKRLAVGTNVRKWNINDGNKYLIYTHSELDITQFPAVQSYLNQHKQRLEKRASSQK